MRANSFEERVIVTIVQDRTRHGVNVQSQLCKEMSSKAVNKSSRDLPMKYSCNRRCRPVSGTAKRRQCPTDLPAEGCASSLGAHNNGSISHPGKPVGNTSKESRSFRSTTTSKTLDYPSEQIHGGSKNHLPCQVCTSPQLDRRPLCRWPCYVYTPCQSTSA